MQMRLCSWGKSWFRKKWGRIDVMYEGGWDLVPFQAGRLLSHGGTDSSVVPVADGSLRVLFSFLLFVRNKAGNAIR